MENQPFCELPLECVHLAPVGGRVDWCAPKSLAGGGALDQLRRPTITRLFPPGIHDPPRGRLPIGGGLSFQEKSMPDARVRWFHFWYHGPSHHRLRPLSLRLADGPWRSFSWFAQWDSINQRQGALSVQCRSSSPGSCCQVRGTVMMRRRARHRRQRSSPPTGCCCDRRTRPVP